MVGKGKGAALDFGGEIVGDGSAGVEGDWDGGVGCVIVREERCEPAEATCGEEEDGCGSEEDEVAGRHVGMRWVDRRSGSCAVERRDV